MWIVKQTQPKEAFMQIKSLHRQLYTISSYALRHNSVSPTSNDGIASIVQKWNRLKSSGVSDAVCQETLGISRATYYRYLQKLKMMSMGIPMPSKRPKQTRTPLWTEAQLHQLLTLRRDHPTYGKAKLAVILKRDHGWTLSESTVGRMLSHLMSNGLITKSISALRKKRKRSFTKGHAKPWTFKPYKDMVMGERVQIDHMTVTINGISFKQFQAWDRVSKHIHANIYSNAKSSSAKRFLIEFVKNAPFKLLSIQVDGGSEFMAEFEEACSDLKIPLLVLPPRKPQYNGGVERGNRTFREEFYANPNLMADSIGHMRHELSKALHIYNTYRPQGNLIKKLRKIV
jgi:putative transposase